MSVLFDFVIVLDGFFPQSDSHKSAHDESENSPRVRNEPGSSSRDGQPIRVDAPDHAVIPGDVEMQGEEFEVGANDENSNFQRVPDHPSEPRLPHPRRRITSQQFERNVRARQSTSSFHPVFFRVKLLWHSVRIAWNLFVCRINNGKRLVSK